MRDQEGILGGGNAGLRLGRSRWPYGGGIAGRVLLAAEFLVLYGVPPLVLMRWPRPGVLFPMLAVGAGVCLWVLLRDGEFERRRLWGWRGLGRRVGRMLPAIAVAMGVMWAGVAVFAPELLFGLVREQWRLWLVIMMVYPLLSVYPQEVIFRAFCFHRYRGLFRGKWAMIGASTAAFGFVHILFWNWLAIALSVVGGFLFARTYERERSLGVVWVEHALYGCFLFTIGLGRYFYSGAVGR